MSQIDYYWGENLQQRPGIYLKDVEPLIKNLVVEGLSAFIGNEHLCRMGLMLADNVPIPIVVNPGGSEDCYVSSPICHYIRYTQHEIKKSHAGKLLFLSFIIYFAPQKN